MAIVRLQPAQFALGLLLVLGLTVSVSAAPVSDIYAGFSVSVKQPRQWVTQLTHTPGVTSKLCLRRHVPDVLLCIQSLLTPISEEELPQLADGFVTAITERFGVAMPAQLKQLRFEQVAGLGHAFQVSPSQAPEGLTEVWLFAGRGPRGQAQMVVAFTSAKDGDRAQEAVSRTVNSLSYHANAF